MRWLAAGVIAIVGWLLVAGQVPNHERLRLTEVVVGAAVSQPFGCTSLEVEPFDDLCPMHHRHTGIDLAAATGTEVHSATHGAAITGFDPSACGNFVVVWMDAHVRVLYCHLSELRVQSGASIEPGQVIGLVGSTGLSTGSHLHLQVDIDGVPVDPATWLAP